MRDNIVVDSCAILSMLNGEANAHAFWKILCSTKKNGGRLLLSQESVYELKKWLLRLGLSDNEVENEMQQVVQDMEVMDIT